MASINNSAAAVDHYGKIVEETLNSTSIDDSMLGLLDSKLNFLTQQED